jgi:hypothetical protein
MAATGGELCDRVEGSANAVIEANVMFEATRPFLFFDYFRIPYRVAVPELEGRRWYELPPVSRASATTADGNERSDRALFWLASAPDDSDWTSGLRKGAYRLGEIPIFGHVVPDDVLSGWLARSENTWSRTTAVVDGDGNEIASVWRSDDGSVFLPFDPAEVMLNYWSEAYQTVAGITAGTGIKSGVRRLYYRVRPLIPRKGQIALRRLFSHVQAQTSFPSWPVETGLHDLYDWLLEQVAGVATVPVPWLAHWPKEFSWALVLTHDVETSHGYRSLHSLRDLEMSAGYRSCWNFVAGRYAVDEALVHELLRDGFEVGVHGLVHDGRDLGSRRLLFKRLPAMHENAARWHAKGFRSPSLLRSWDLVALLGFEYDSSYPDTDPYQPQSGGCCSWLPFFNRDVLELPVTLAQDHTLFEILEQSSPTIWFDKTDVLRQRGGMALLITHPDYMGPANRLAAYEDFLRRYASDDEAWHALPGEVSAWWRRRAASHVRGTGGEWEIEGPAAKEGKVEFAFPAT